MAQRRAKDALRELNLRPSKTRGQNFLIDPAVIGAIVDFGNPSSADHMVEIGPGLGALTEPLSRIGKLSVIEIEEKFCAELGGRFPGIEVVNSDVRKVNFSRFGSNLLVFGNLPYAFSTDIVFHLIDNAESISRAVLLLQKEFAERMAAAPGGRDYGVLSISCQLKADIGLGPIITGNCFHPPAGVDSRLVEMKFLSQCRYPIADMVWFKKVVRASFLQRRKKLVNSLMSSGFFSRERVDQGLTTCGIDPGRRAETLEIAEFVRMAEALSPQSRDQA